MLHHTYVTHCFAQSLRQMGVSVRVEDSSPMNTGIMDIAIPVGALSDATTPDYRNKGLARPPSGDSPAARPPFRLRPR